MTFKRTHFIVEYGLRTARFSDYDDAQRFAATMSRLHCGADVYDPKGIVGQWRDGIPSDEFEGIERYA